MTTTKKRPAARGRGRLGLALGVLGSVAILAGCQGRLIGISYDRPAEYRIPQDIRRIAVASLVGKTEADRRYGDLAADHLASKLEAYNRTANRYELVDRKRLGAMLAQQDKLPVSDTLGSSEVGRIAGVDAVVYGTVSLTSRDQRASRAGGFDLRTQRSKRIDYIKRCCTATVNFTIDGVKASKTLATVALTKEYDSSVDEQPGAIGGAGGTSEGNLTPVEQIADRLIEQCAQQFVWKISPHSVTFQVQMAKGKTKLVAAGNELARSGKYAEALDCYLRAMELRPDDDGAVFNAGLMFEALQQFQKADDCYTKAFAIKDRDTYLLARKRVRQGSDYQ